jgi:curved DNA-binding protein CbpA
MPPRLHDGFRFRVRKIPPKPMDDYYALLGIKPSCTQKEIKRAFREKAKQFHPDLTGGDTAKSDMMRLLLLAYEVLSNSVRRREHDAQFRSELKSYVFDYRVFLKARPDESDMQAKLVFFDLLHGEEDEAVAVFDRVFGTGGVNLRKNLDREDFMDCAFLLAEAFEERGRFVDAFQLLKAIVKLEIEKPYFRHFFSEVMDKLKKLVREDLPKSVSEEEYVQALEDMIGFNFSRRDNALHNKKIAEIYARRGFMDMARAYLGKALECDRYLAGVKALRKKLDM